MTAEEIETLQFVGLALVVLWLSRSTAPTPVPATSGSAIAPVTAAAPQVGSMDPAVILAGILPIYAGVGLDPFGNTPNVANADYYIDKIQATGGWDGPVVAGVNSNAGYWTDRIARDLRGAGYGI